MAGGIFQEQPFSLNPKCIIITFIFAICYWYLPPKNWYILFFILWITYIAIAWYDYVFKCHYKLKPTIFPLGKYVYLPFKPPDYQKEYKNLSEKKLAVMEKVNDISLWTIIIVSSFFLVRYFMLNKKNKNIKYK